MSVKLTPNANSGLASEIATAAAAMAMAKELFAAAQLQPGETSEAGEARLSALLVKRLSRVVSENRNIRLRDIARWKRDSELLMAIQDGCWDVRFARSVSENGRKYDVTIQVLQHHMSAPHERVIGEEPLTEDLRAALEQAVTAEPYPLLRGKECNLAAPTASSSHGNQHSESTQKCK